MSIPLCGGCVEQMAKKAITTIVNNLKACESDRLPAEREICVPPVVVLYFFNAAKKLNLRSDIIIVFRIRHQQAYWQSFWRHSKVDR